MEQNAKRLLSFLPRRVTKTTHRSITYIPQQHRVPGGRLEDKPTVVTDDGMAAQHPEWLLEQWPRRSKHDFPIPRRDITRFDRLD